MLTWGIEETCTRAQHSCTHLHLHVLTHCSKAPSQGRAQQPEVELGIAGLLDASSYRLVQKVVASSTPMRWPSSVMLCLVAFGCLSRGRGTSPETRPWTLSVRTGLDGFMEAYDIEAARSGVRGLASPHPFLGWHYWQSCSLSACCLGCTVWDSSGSGYASVLCALLGLTVDTVHVSVYGGFWLLFHTFPCEG